MPTICRFRGLVIRMHYDDHGPPHFHVHRGRRGCVVDVLRLRVIRGTLSPADARDVLRWAALRQRALLRSWRRAGAHLPLLPIAPLA